MRSRPSVPVALAVATLALAASTIPAGQASLYFNDPSGNHLEIVTTGFATGIPVRAPELQRLAWKAKRFPSEAAA